MPGRRLLPITASLALCLPFAAACDLVRAPTAIGDVEERVQVHSVLTAGDSAVAVLVTRTERPVLVDGPGGGKVVRYVPDPVQGADVVLIRGPDTMTLLPATPEMTECNVSVGFGGEPEMYRAGCYWAGVPGRVQAGETYDLRVGLPEGGDVTGRTRIPPPPVILGPPPGDTLVRDEPVVLRWQSVDDPVLQLHATTADCEVILLDPRTNSFIRGTTDVAGQDSLAFSLATFECHASGSEAPPSALGHIVLTRYSRAYAEYLAFQGHEHGTITEEVAGPGLTGAIGVFAGAAQDSASYLFVVDAGAFNP